MTKKYDTAQSPFQRARVHPSTPRKSIAGMDRTMTRLKPGDLFRQIQTLTAELEGMTLSKAPAPIKPRVNVDFNRSPAGGFQMRQ